MRSHSLRRGFAFVLLSSACSIGAGCFPDRPQADADQPIEPAITPTPGAEMAPLSEHEPEPEPQTETEPETEPEPPAFVGRETVRVEELLAALTDEVPRLAKSETIAADYQAFLDRFELEHEDELYLDYVRIKIAFESTRAGGWWGLYWDITNEQPNSEKIWAAWHTLESDSPVPEQSAELAAVPEISATAECDELSALFAYVAQRIGLSKDSEVGLLWPTNNHVVAVWTIHANSDAPVRVVVPTSQIFLDETQSLGTDGFDPWRQKTIFDYRREDADLDLTLPGPLASAFVQAVRDHGERSQAELQERRNDREQRQLWSQAEDHSAP